ncbi:MAG: DAK2 domain-containing protein, partial [Anaerolineae bacterium]|nr:DAK2 domain-containing protein [Anaerolineae bacterium]
MEENRVPLSQLFGAVAQTVDERKDYLNNLDGSSGNTGDNAAYNWQVVAQAAAEAEAMNPDAGFVLAAGAQALTDHGRGKTAAMYARGLRQAATQFQGQQGMTLSDFQPLVEGMTTGMQKGSQRVG